MKRPCLSSVASAAAVTVERFEANHKAVGNSCYRYSFIIFHDLVYLQSFPGVITETRTPEHKNTPPYQCQVSFLDCCCSKVSSLSFFSPIGSGFHILF